MCGMTQISVWEHLWSRRSLLGVWQARQQGAAAGAAGAAAGGWWRTIRGTFCVCGPAECVWWRRAGTQLWLELARRSSSQDRRPDRRGLSSVLYSTSQSAFAGYGSKHRNGSSLRCELITSHNAGQLARNQKRCVHVLLAKFPLQASAQPQHRHVVVAAAAHEMAARERASALHARGTWWGRSSEGGTAGARGTLLQVADEIGLLLKELSKLILLHTRLK